MQPYISIILITIIIYFNLLQVKCQQCESSNQLFNFVEKKCSQCHPNCGTCFGLSEFDCSSCNGSCSKECQKGMYKDLQTKKCDFCQVYGCDECTIDQKCLKCHENLELDQQTGKCNIKDNTCLNQQVFSIESNKCAFICDINTIEDETHKLCNPIQFCNQIVQYPNFSQEIQQRTFNVLSNNQIIINTQKCQFYIFDDNLQFVYNLKLSPDSFQDKTMLYYQSQFIQDDIGGCQHTERTIGYNFVKKQIEFLIEGELNTFYTLYSILTQVKILILYEMIKGFYVFFDYNSNRIIFEYKEPRYFNNIGVANILNKVIYTTEVDNVSIIKYLLFILFYNQQSVFLLLKIGIISTYIYNVQHNKYYQVNGAENPELFYQLFEEDRTFILVTKKKQYKLFQFDIQYLSIQEIVLYDQINENLKLDKIIQVHQKKRYIFFTKLNQIDIFQHSKVDNKINFIMTIMNRDILYSYASLNFIENEKNQTLLLLYFNRLDLLQLINIEESINNKVYDLQDSIQIQLQNDRVLSDSLFYIKNNQIDLFYSIGTEQTQLYRKRIQIKNNKFEDIGFISKSKIQSSISYNSYSNLQQIQGTTQQNGVRLLYFPNQKRSFYLDFKIYFQNPQTLQIGKIQIKQYFENKENQEVSQMFIDENIYLIYQRLKNSNCFIHLVDYEADQVLFTSTATCINFDPIVYSYIKQKKMLFVFNYYALYDIASSKRVLSFSATDNLLYYKSYIYSIFKDQKILISDKLGNFFCFDLDVLEFQQLIKDSLIKVTTFYYSTFRPIKQNKNKYALTINDSIYVLINNIYLEEYSFQNKYLYQEKKINLSSFSNYQSLDLSFNLYKNQLLIPNKYILNIYSSRLDLVDTISLPGYKISASNILIIESFVLMFGENILYKIDLNTKQASSLQITNQQEGMVVQYIDTQKQIVIINALAVQYIKLNLLYQFKYETESKYLNSQNILSQSSQIFKLGNQLSYVLNIENKAISQTSFLESQIFISSQISPKTQVAYYYDNSKKQIIRQNILSNSIENSYSFTETYSNIYVDFILDVFIYTQAGGILKVFNPNQQQQQINLIKQFDGITNLKFCYNLSLMIIQTTSNQIFIINYINPEILNTKLDLGDVTSSIKSNKLLVFQVQCFNNLVYLESPFLKFFTLDGNPHSFQITDSITYQNTKQSSPIVDLQNKIIIYPFSNFGQYILRNDNVQVQNLFSYTATTTKLYYDLEDNMLVVLIGASKTITTVDCVLGYQKYIYSTVSTFNYGSVDQFIPKLNTIILFDNTPSIYIYNYLNNTVSIKQIQFTGCQSIIFDENNSYIYLQTLSSIHVYSYLDLSYIESLIDYSNPSNSNIESMKLVSQINALIVYRQDKQILTYDLIQTVVLKEKNIFEQIKIQSLAFEQDLIVMYSILDSNLVLFENTVVKDQLVLDISNVQLPNKCDLYKLNEQKLVYISEQRILVVKIDYISKKLEIQYKFELIFSHTDSLYDQQNSQILLIHQKTKQIYILKLNDLNQGVVLAGQLNQKYEQLLICNIQIIYFFNNRLIAQSTINLQKANEIQLSINNISYIKKLSQIQNISKMNEFYNYNNENTFDSETNLKILAISNEDKMLYIVNSENLQVIISKQINYRILKIEIDAQKKIIFSISNILITYIYDYNLNQLSTIKNPCLLDTKILFDDKFIYSFCPNTVYFYNSLTLELQKFAITKGFNDIVSIKPIDKQNSFILIRRSGITVLQFIGTDQSQIRTIFTQQSENIYIYKQEITYDINHQSYLNLKGLSWQNIVEYFISFQQSEKCISSLKYFGIETTQQLINQIQASVSSSKQQIKQIMLKLSHNQRLDKINIAENAVKGIQLVLYSGDKQTNIVDWDKENIVEDLHFNQLIIHDITFKIIGNIQINKNKNLNKLLLQNVDIIHLQNELIIENIDIVHLIDVSFNSFESKLLEGIDSVITFKNCKKVIFNKVNILSLNIERKVLFKFENVEQIVIQHFNISKSKINKCIQIYNSTLFLAKEIDISEINGSQESFIEGVIVSDFQISILNSNKIQDYQLFNLKGCSKILIENINLINVQNILLAEIQSYENTLVYPTFLTSFNNLKIEQSKDIKFILQSQTIKIENSVFLQIKLNTNDFIYSQLSNIIINACKFSEFNLSDDFSIINLNNFNNVQLKDIVFQKSAGNLLYFINQNKQKQIDIDNLSLLDNTHLSNSVIILNLSQNIKIQNSLFENNISQLDGGALKITNSGNLKIQKNVFKLNKSNIGRGGSLFISNTKSVNIESSEFIQNECFYNSGGAIFIENTYQQILKAAFVQCKLINNKAIYGYGGAIGLSRIDLQLDSTVIQSNSAAIGGGIFYQQVIPSIIKDKKLLIQDNLVFNNTSILYGNNVGSTLRKIKLNNIKQNYQNYSIKVQESSDLSPDGIYISNFKSGGYISLNDLQFVDEEGNNFKEINNLKYHQSILDIIQAATLRIDTNDKKNEIKFSGDTSAQFENGSFQMNLSASYQINETANFFIKSQQIPSLLDSEGDIFIPEKYLTLQFIVSFRNCIIGEIKKEFLSSTICEECDGKYSLNIQDQSCQVCPLSAEKCYGSNIILKDGYWREGDQSDEITYCQKAPFACQSQNPDSKFGCIEGYIGPACEQCDISGKIWNQRYSTTIQSNSCEQCKQNYAFFIMNILIFFSLQFLYLLFAITRIVVQAEKVLCSYYLKLLGILFLSNSVTTFQSPDYLKILVDHLQIISVISRFNLQFPSFLNYGTDSIGSPLQIQSFSLDCFFPHQILNGTPYWVIKFIWSVLLPFILMGAYVLFQNVKHLLKFNRNHIRFNKTAFIYIYLYFFPSLITTISETFNCRKVGSKKYSQVDLMIDCMDYDKHQKYVLSLVLPFFLIFCVGFLAFLSKKIRFEKKFSGARVTSCKYKFLYQPYKDSMYHWDIIRLIFKAAIMFTSMLLYEYLSIRACTINTILISYYLCFVKLSPYMSSSRNYLESQSLIISILTINFALLYQGVVDLNSQLSSLIPVLIFLFNGYFIIKLILYIFSKPIPYSIEKQNFYQRILFKLKQKYPNKFLFITIQNKVSLSSLNKFKFIKSKIKVLANKRKNQFQQYEDFLMRSVNEEVEQSQILNRITRNQSIYSSTQIQSVKFTSPSIRPSISIAKENDQLLETNLSSQPISPLILPSKERFSRFKKDRQITIQEDDIFVIDEPAVQVNNVINSEFQIFNKS